MQKVTRIGVLSLAKLMGGISFVFGLFFGAVFTLFSVLGASVAAFESSAAEGLIGLLFGVGALFVLPVLYGLFGFLQGLVAGFLANVAFRLFGGLELELEAAEPG